MPQIKPSFIAEVRSALASSKFTTSDFSIETPDTGRVLIMITFIHRPEYFINLTEEERSDQYTVEQKFLGTTETRRVKEVVYKVRLAPGSVKLTDVIELIEPQEFIRQVSNWCESIQKDLFALNSTIDPLEELRAKLQLSIDNVITDAEGVFTATELSVIDDRFDKLYDDIEALKDQYAISKRQLDELKAEISEFKSSARSFPKGIWAKITGNKLVRATGKLINTPEGRTFLFQQVRRALGMNDEN